MFGEISKLFDRNFVLGYFLPAALFLLTNVALLAEVDQIQGLWSLLIQPPAATATSNATTPTAATPAAAAPTLPQQVDLLQETKKDILLSTGVVGLLAWFLGIVLLVLNWEIFRAAEGYWLLQIEEFGPLANWRPFTFLERRRFAGLQARRRELMRRGRIFGAAAIPAELARERDKLQQEMALRFPDKAIYLLPTAFGNVVRAFEVYPRVIYGFDIIPGWNRLLAVIPGDYRDVINNAKTRTDFWLNLGFLSLVLVAECGLLWRFGSGGGTVAVAAAGAVCIALLAYRRAISAAMRWGHWVKSAFDVYLPTLREQMGYGPPRDGKDERVLWEAFSQATIYRLPGSMDKISTRRAKSTSEPAGNRANTWF